jgi:hypothetical protein
VPGSVRGEEILIVFLPAGMMVATGKWKHSELSWRLPLFVQCVPAGLNVLLVFFCPET